MRFKCSWLLPLLLLTSCGKLHVETRIQRVYCVTPEQYTALVKAEPEKMGNKLDSDARKANTQLVSQNILMRQYADGLLTVIGGCTGPAPSPSE